MGNSCMYSSKQSLCEKAHPFLDQLCTCIQYIHMFVKHFNANKVFILFLFMKNNKIQTYVHICIQRTRAIAYMLYILCMDNASSLGVDSAPVKYRQTQLSYKNFIQFQKRIHSFQLLLLTFT